MNIGIVLDYERDWPPGIRVEKHTVALAADHQAVFVFTPSYNAALPAVEYVDRVKCTVWRARVDKSKPRLADTARRAVTLFDERYSSELTRFIAECHIDILVVHDIWMLAVAQQAAARARIPVVADLHENMPAALVAARSEIAFPKKLFHGVLWNYHLMRWHERRLLRRCIHTVVVTEEATERLREYGLTAHDYSVVSNTEDETTFDSRFESADPEILSRYRDHFVISYVGTIGAHRGLDTVLRAIPACGRRIPNLKMVIVGADPRGIEAIRHRIGVLGIADRVDVYGWMPFVQAQSFIKASDVCLVPHGNFEHTQTTIPHKLFQYMLCAKPVLVSDCRPLKRVVGAAHCGQVFRADDPDSFTAALVRMHDDRAMLATYGANGRRSALGTFSWKHDARTLTELFRKLGAPARPSAAAV